MRLTGAAAATTVVHVLRLLVHPHDHDGVMQPPDSYGLRMLPPRFPAPWWWELLQLLLLSDS